VVLRVIDTGPGIEETELPRIFDRFYRGGNSKGSGLGLTIARDLVAAHGGTIAAASQPGRGTTITIRLPMPA
jgi:signal transduction histidine kinase